jgi:arylsulfatase A-like enzyme
MASTVEQQIELLERDYGGLEAIGGPLLENLYHHGWAWAGDTPFKSAKLIAAHFGGTRTPCVIHWPKGIQPDPKPRSQFHHVIDIVPTLYEVAGITPPRQVDGVEQMALDGDSMVYSFNHPDAPEQKRPQFFDIMGSRGIYQDGWFAAAFGPKKPWSTDLSGSNELGP